MISTPDPDRDIIEMSDDKGNPLSFEVQRYFFYNGDEYALVRELDESGAVLPGDESAYIMRVDNIKDDNGESWEEFSPVSEEDGAALLELLRSERVDIMLADEEE